MQYIEIYSKYLEKHKINMPFDQAHRMFRLATEATC